MFIKSKIQFFESKSQLYSQWQTKPYRCLSSQRYNFLKANHNEEHHAYRKEKLFIKSKIQFFESKSQHFDKRSGGLQSCLSSQRYNFLKANHNHSMQFPHPTGVVYQVKDTIFWKQITTLYNCGIAPQMLFIKSKIQFFESINKRNLKMLLKAVKVVCGWTLN